LTIQERLRPELTALDGRWGRNSQRRGIRTTMPLWSAHGLIDAPELVRAIHEEYTHAGRIITTNTFRTGIRAMRAAGIGERARNSPAWPCIWQSRRARTPLDDQSGSPGRSRRSRTATRRNWSPARRSAARSIGLLAAWLAEAGCDLPLVDDEHDSRLRRAGGSQCHRTAQHVQLRDRYDARLLSGESLAEAVAAPAPLATRLRDQLRPARVHRGAIPELAGVARPGRALQSPGGTARCSAGSFTARFA
jgi:homocysteine S-methyltransferase